MNENDLYESVIPANIELKEADRVQSVVNKIIPWPRSTNIINEFSCEGYVSMAFPTLFPYGLAGLNDNTRLASMKVSPLQYFQFLMQYKDQHFAKDPRFRFFALNTIQRHDAIKRGSEFAKKISFQWKYAAIVGHSVSRSENIKKFILLERIK